MSKSSVRSAIIVTSITCGFKPASEFGIRYHGLPEGEDASFFLCKELVPGYLDGVCGEYATPSGYFVDEAAEEFPKLYDALVGKYKSVILIGLKR